MRIVNTFISETNEIPKYTEHSLRQARKFNPSIPIDFISPSPAEYFEELNINWINQSGINSEELKRFKEVSWFDRHGTPNTTHPSPEGFWQKTAERIFYLQAYIKQNNLNEIFHFENDVLLYDSINEIQTTDKLTVTPMSSSHTTFAFTFIPTAEEITKLCCFFNNALSFGENNLLSLGYDHISEMSLLNMSLKNNLVSVFPVVPAEDQKYVFDPGSYGQHLGGTNNGHAEGFIDPSHVIGAYIKTGKIETKFEECPYVKFKYSKDWCKVFNLHVHSKNLERFV
jgi:hypothetical protein